MAVPAVNLTIEKGTSFEATFTVTNADGSVFSLVNQSAIAKIRKHSTATEYQSFATGITTATGIISVSMASTITAELTAGRNYYDVIIINSSTNTTKKVFEGNAIVNETISV